MELDLSEVKTLRKKLGISQQELAKKSGVSQSLIAKVESGKLDPSYSNARRIIDCLVNAKKNKTLKIKDIMSRKIISVSSKDSLKKAIQKMKLNAISQLPVIDNRIVTGVVSETTILNLLDKNPSQLLVEDAMSDPPPIISKNSTTEAAASLLKHFSMVLVSDKGKLEGVVTKADVIRNMGKGL